MGQEVTVKHNATSFMAENRANEEKTDREVSFTLLLCSLARRTNTVRLCRKR